MNSIKLLIIKITGVVNLQEGATKQFTPNALLPTLYEYLYVV